MKIKTRFLIVIMIVILGFSSIGGLAWLFSYKINQLKQSDLVCVNTLNTLKELQLLSAELLSTNELDNTFDQWKLLHGRLSLAIEALNNSDSLHELLVTEKQKSILSSLYSFWLATRQKLTSVEHKFENFFSGKNYSRDGLILQYLELSNHKNLTNRNNVHEVIRYLRSEFEVKLTKLILMVDEEINRRYGILLVQITILSFIVALVVSMVLISFLTRIQDYLGQLHRSMEIIGKGDFTEKIAVKGEDELSQISRAINLTTDNLKGFHAVLEQRIEELFMAQQEAEKASQAKSVFLANMSHELRTPLNAIIGFSNLIAKNKDLNPDERENLSIISQSGKHLLSLINNVLAMSKIEAGKTILNENEINLYDLLHDIEGMFQLKAMEKALSFSMTCDPDVSEKVQVDDVKLRQILINLINNGMKFTWKGGVKVRVRMGNPNPFGFKKKKLMFEIIDTGSGIHREAHEKIFDAFVQLKDKNHVQEGTGLGLAISRNYVRLMGGKIAVESTMGKGSNFSFFVPVTQVSDVLISDLTMPCNKIPRIPGIDRVPGVSVKDKNQEFPCSRIFETIPASLLDKLEQALLRAEMDRIILLIDNIGTYNQPFAKELGKLADGFQYDQIGDLLKHRNNKSG